MPAKAAATDGPHSGKQSFLRRDDVARIVPFALYMLFIAIADGLGQLGLSAAELRWLYSVKIAAVVMALIAYRRYYSELARCALTAGAALASVATGVVVLVLWIALDAPWMLVGTSAGFDPTDAGGQIDWLLVVIRIAGAALVVPVMEELFWRSFLMRWLTVPQFLTVRPGSVTMVALLITSVLFGLEHHQWFAGVVAGLAYGLLYMRTNNIWAAILAHAITNGLLGIWVVQTTNWAYW